MQSQSIPLRPTNIQVGARNQVKMTMWDEQVVDPSTDDNSDNHLEIQPEDETADIAEEWEFDAETCETLS
jgi:hypothetical protein